MSAPITRAAPAKVNLFLRVLAREQDGFHGIETLFCRLDLADRLTVERTEAGVALTGDRAGLGPDAENLAVRAAEMVLAATGRRFGVRIGLEKRIPVGAGLGGGSSDAAAALEGVNALAGNAVPHHELLHFGARLGSDVPFFLSGGPLALGWGHGERLLRLPALPPMPVLLLVPPEAIVTAEAYRWVDEARAGAGRRGGLALEPSALGGWSDVARMAGNDFESAVFGRMPAVRDGFDALARTHPLLCRMTGSGSTLFAVYRNPKGRDDAAMMLGSRFGRLIAAATAGD